MWAFGEYNIQRWDMGGSGMNQIEQTRPGVACGGTISDAWGGLGPIAAP